MKMISRINRAVLILLLTGVVLTGLSGESVRVGIYDNPPQVFLSEEGIPQGIFIDFLEDVALQEGWEIEYVEAAFSELLVRLEKGELDLVPSVARSYERLKRFSLNRLPVLENWAVLYRAESTIINNIFDLEGKRILGLRGGIHLGALRRLCTRYGIECRFVEVASYHAAMEGIQKGHGEVAVVNRTFSTRVGGRYKAVSTLLSFNPIPLHFAAPKGQHPALIHALDTALARQLDDPDSSLQRSFNQWLRPEASTRIPPWLLVLTLVLLLGTLLLFTGILILRILVRNRTRELEKERGRTLEAMRSQKIFFKTMSHEIRTPLNQLCGMVEIVRDENRQNPRLEEDLRVIQDAAGKMETLLTSVLQFADLDRGDFRISPVPVRLSELLGDIYRLAGTFPRNPRVAFEKDFHLGGDPVVLLDPKALTRVALNLLHNAFKYTEAGKVVFSARTVDGPGTGATVPDGEGGRICIEIMDTGKGMTADEMRWMDTPFRSAPREASGGAGLGLPIVHQLLKLMGARLHVESEPGKGSRFWSEIPFPQAADA